MKPAKEYIQEMYDKSSQSLEETINKAQKEAYNQALKDFWEKLIVSSKFSEYDKKLECWSNKDTLLKQLKK